MLEFTWQSFAFAVVNFLILAFLLYKLLHRPLLRVLDKRSQGIEETRKAAAEETVKARQAREEYEAKLAAAEQERDKLLADARTSAEEAGRKLVEKASAQARRDVDGLRQAYEQERLDALKKCREDIVAAGIEIAQLALEKTVDTDLHSRLNDRLIRELDGLASEAPENRTHTFEGELPVRVISARALHKGERKDVQQRIKALAGDDAEIAYETEKTLIAGTRVEFSAMAVDSSLRDVLDAVGEHAMAPEKSGSAKEEDS